eukprot:Skav206604  [mRNA]  locus=scaffold332:130492:136580:+ [translate_table: standard]
MLSVMKILSKPAPSNFCHDPCGKTPCVTKTDTFFAPLFSSSDRHASTVPPVLHKSSTMNTCFPLGSPSATRTTRLSPSRTLLQKRTG